MQGQWVGLLTILWPLQCGTPSRVCRRTTAGLLPSVEVHLRWCSAHQRRRSYESCRQASSRAWRSPHRPFLVCWCRWSPASHCHGAQPLWGLLCTRASRRGRECWRGCCSCPTSRHDDAWRTVPPPLPSSGDCGVGTEKFLVCVQWKWKWQWWFVGTRERWKRMGFFAVRGRGFVGGGSFGGVGVVGVVAWGHHLQFLVATAQWVALVEAWKN